MELSADLIWQIHLRALLFWQFSCKKKKKLVSVIKHVRVWAAAADSFYSAWQTLIFSRDPTTTTNRFVFVVFVVLFFFHPFRFLLLSLEMFHGSEPRCWSHREAAAALRSSEWLLRRFQVVFLVWCSVTVSCFSTFGWFSSKKLIQSKRFFFKWSMNAEH